MDIQRAVSDFVDQGMDLLHRLRSSEGTVLTAADLHLLRVQLHLLNSEASIMQYAQNRPGSRVDSLPVPPTSSDFTPGLLEPER